MAAQTVFHNVELCVEILHYLPLKDLLLSQRVCTLWRDTITSSSALQKQLFLKPAQIKTVWLIENAPPAPAHPAYGKFSSYLRVKGAVSLGSNEIAFHDGTVRRPVSLNKICLEKGIDNDLDRTLGLGSSARVHGFLYSGEMEHNKSASWRNMLCCQPPTHEATAETILEKQVHGQSRLDKEYTHLRNEKGLTCGEVSDACRSAIQSRGSAAGEVIRCLMYMRAVACVTPWHEEAVRRRTKKWRKEIASL